MDASLVGYVSAVVLVLTIAIQIRRQWASGDDTGVSPWLFAGQLVASIGFTVYSVAKGDVVFIATNASMALAAVCGLGIVGYHRRVRARRAGAPGVSSRNGPRT